MVEVTAVILRAGLRTVDVFPHDVVAFLLREIVSIAELTFDGLLCLTMG